MNKINKLFLPLAAILLTTVSCSEEANDWPVDPSTDRLFRTSHFEIVELMPTSVLLNFNGVTDATKYVLEFSLGDSLQFNNIVKTEEIKADTLTPYSEGKFIVQNEYRKLIEDLNGTTRYSVRIKAVNENDCNESGYFGLSFFTPAEQIFIGATPGIFDATLRWEADKAATAIRYGSVLAKDTTWISEMKLSDAQCSKGEAQIKDLNPGTRYVAQIYNGEFIRGTYNFSTLGSAIGQTITVQPGDNVNELMVNATDETLTLVFTGGTEYEIGGVTVPENIKNLYLVGSVVDDQLPRLLIPSFGLSGPIETLNLQYVEIDANGGFWMMLSGMNVFSRLNVSGCFVHNLNNCFVYASADGEIDEINIKDSRFDHVSTGGWGVFNITGNTTMHNLVITNTTITEVADQLMDIRRPLDLIKLDKVTFCNYQVGLPKMFLCTKQPKEAQVTNSIFAGDNAGQKINSGYGNYSAWLDFSGCYVTSDLVEDSKKFTNATHLDITSEMLFVDPRNGDFHIKPEVIFRGKGKAGDPRWW